MKNKTLNIIGICGTGLGIVIAWCARCAMYFFHDHRPLNFLPVLLIQAAALALFLVMWRVKLPAWVSVVSLAAGGLGLVLSLVVAIVNLPNLPHFGNNLLEMLPVLVLGTAAAALYLLYDRLKASRAARFAALSIAGGVAAAAIGLTLPGYLTTGAVVFDTGGQYTVEFLSNRRGLGFVEVTKDGKTETYYHAAHGKNVAHTTIHQVDIPKDALRGATYRVGVKSVLFTVSNHTFFGNTVHGKPTPFRTPVSEEGGTFFTVSDIHAQPGGAIHAVSAQFDRLDFIVCLGDWLSYASSRYDLSMLVDFMAEVSRGELPVVYVRGNHELLGEEAERLQAYIPTPNGEFYYTLAYNNAYFLINDLAFNKADAYPGFSGLSDGENYRTHQTAFVEQAVSEAEAAEAAYFVHLSHIPISTETVPLRQNLKGIVDLLNDAADVSICGHTHHFRVESPSVRVHFPVVQQGGNPDADPSRYLGAVFTLSGGHITVEKIDASGNIQERIPLS